MESNHTPGPWRIDKDHPQRIIAPQAEIADNLIAIAGYGYASSFKPPGQDEADAKLIAAAPDLLEACEATMVILAYIGSAQCECDYSVGMAPCPTCEANHALKVVQAAIAKATK